MKKIISTVALILICSINANSQEKKVATESAMLAVEAKETEETKIAKKQQNIKKEAYDLVKYLNLDDSNFSAFTEVLVTKYEVLNNKANSEERKIEFIAQLEEKFKNILKPEQFEKLKSNKELYFQLFGYGKKNE
jgi:superfamily II helicase